MEIIFRRAEPDDLDAVYKIFASAVSHMRQQGIEQWDEIYPDRSVLCGDIQKEQLYLGMANGEIASVYVLNRDCDPEYANGNWAYPEESFLVIHRFCVNPAYQNQGIGRKTMHHIEAILREKGVSSVRLDAFTENPHAVRMYEKLGYCKVGYADWRKGRFYLMEKGL